MRLSVRAALTPPYALLAQLVEQRSFKPQVVGSRPTGRTICTSGAIGRRSRLRTCARKDLRVRLPPCAPYGLLAQSVERQTEDLRVPGSIPGEPTIYGSVCLAARAARCKRVTQKHRWFESNPVHHQQRGVHPQSRKSTDERLVAFEEII